MLARVLDAETETIPLVEIVPLEAALEVDAVLEGTTTLVDSAAVDEARLVDAATVDEATSEVVEVAALVVDADTESVEEAETVALVEAAVLVYVLPTYGAHTLGSLSFAGSFVRYPSFTPSR